MAGHQFGEQQKRMEGGIEEVATEVVRAVAVLGTALNRVAGKSHASGVQVGRAFQTLASEHAGGPGVA